MFLPP